MMEFRVTPVNVLDIKIQTLMLWQDAWSVSFYLSYVSAINTKDWNLFSFQMRTMPPSCKNAFQATPNGHNAWHWLKVKKVSIACKVVTIAILFAISQVSFSAQPRRKLDSDSSLETNLLETSDVHVNLFPWNLFLVMKVYLENLIKCAMKEYKICQLCERVLRWQKHFLFFGQSKHNEASVKLRLMRGGSCWPCSG